ncbi:MAG TPA: NUDIX domain-containing protein, partial [Edaphobacter sp.]|nr:NUDIX domain-containing protein [Edaphobacter sp.]
MNESTKAVRSGREYPLAPIVGVAAVVLHQSHVLLIRRGREPLLGAWSLPGGALELGETTAEGIVREVFEETGVHIKPVEIVATLDRIVRDEEERVRFHYVLV